MKSLFDTFDDALGGRDAELLAQADAFHENPVVDYQDQFSFDNGGTGADAAEAQPGQALAPGSSPNNREDYKAKMRDLLAERAMERKAASEQFQKSAVGLNKKSNSTYGG